MPTMEQTARDAQAFAESLARAAKDSPELRAKLKSMMGGPLNARERVEDLVLDLMRGNAGPTPPIAAMVAVLLTVAARLVYMDMEELRQAEEAKRQNDPTPDNSLDMSGFTHQLS